MKTRLAGWKTEVDGTKLSLVNTYAFVEAMAEQWAAYGNVPSPALYQVWAGICDTLNEQVLHPTLPRPVIPAELGAGKTTAAKVWCAMLLAEEHPGALVVVRTIDQVGEYVTDINAWSPVPTAGAFHSALKPKPTLAQLRATPTLVVCHRGYELALDELLVEDHERYDRLMMFGDQRRRLAIVDEALDQVYVAQLTRQDFHEVRRLDPRLLKQHMRAVDVIEAVYRALLEAPDDGHHVMSTDALLGSTGLTPPKRRVARRPLGGRPPRSMKPEERRNLKEGPTALRRHLPRTADRERAAPPRPDRHAPCSRRMPAR
jgi:hypothetical protein